LSKGIETVKASQRLKIEQQQLRRRSKNLMGKCKVQSDDYEFFSCGELPAHDNPYYFKETSNPLSFSSIEYRHKGQKRSDNFYAFMQKTGTTSLIIIKDDTLVYEGYFNGHERHTPQKLFSITKSFTSALIGIAIEDGYIRDVNDPVRSYIPELSTNNMTIKQLLQMDAGIKYKEGHFPWRDEAKVYLHPNVRQLALSVTEDTTKNFFHYNDYHPLLLGIILERTTGRKVIDYFYDKIWSKLGMQFPGRMIMDSKPSSFEKLESGLVMTAIDLAKFGSLYLKNGAWAGQQLINQNWVEESVNRHGVPRDMGHFRYYQNHPWGKMWFRQNKAYYKYFWWGHLNCETNNDYLALGAMGQVLYISPENNALAIRTGKKWGVLDWWPTILYKLINS
jgi:CubicO group peptidase (beta-lactamase class C family)